MIDRPTHPILSKLILDEYTLDIIPESLHGHIHEISVRQFRIAAFYLPYPDAYNPPIEGKYGGDSFSIYQSPNDELIFFIRNGVGHGTSGRAAIMTSNRALEETLNKETDDPDLQSITNNIQDLFTQPAALASIWNERIYRKSKQPSTEVAFSCAFGKIINSSCAYALCGDVGIAICEKNGHLATASDRKGFGNIGLGTIHLPYKTFKPYATYTAPILNGTTILLYTDGVVDMIDEDPVIGNNIISKNLVKNCTLHPIELIKQINVLAHQASKKLKDDYTIVAIQRQ